VGERTDPPGGDAPGEPLEVVGLDDVELIDPAAELARARALFLAGDLAGAAASFAEAAQLDPANAEAQRGLGKALARGDPRGARAALERAVALAPGSFECWRALAMRCRADGDEGAATRARDRALAVAPTGDARAALDRDLAGVRTHPR
jgi:Flp pilus assembly protein TadD